MHSATCTVFERAVLLVMTPPKFVIEPCGQCCCLQQPLHEANPHDLLGHASRRYLNLAWPFRRVHCTCNNGYHTHYIFGNLIHIWQFDPLLETLLLNDLI